MIIRVNHGDIKDCILRISSQKRQLFYKDKRVYIFHDFTPEVTGKQLAFTDVKQLLQNIPDVELASFIQLQSRSSLGGGKILSGL